MEPEVLDEVAVMSFGVGMALWAPLGLVEQETVEFECVSAFVARN